MAKKPAARLPHLGYSFAHGRNIDAEEIVGPMKPMASHEVRKPVTQMKNPIGRHRGALKPLKRPVSRKVSR